MIETIRPKSHPKYLTFPILGPYLDDFTQWAHQHGYTLSTIRNHLKDTRHIIFFLQKQGLHSIGELTHCYFEKTYQHFRQDNPSIAGTVRRLQKFEEVILLLDRYTLPVEYLAVSCPPSKKNPFCRRYA